MQTLAELVQNALALPPEKEAIEFEGKHYSWGDVQRVAAETQGAFAAAGVGDGPVSFVPRNRPSALAALAGMLAQGRTIRMIYVFQSATGIAAAIERLDSPVVVMAEEDFTPEVREALTRRSIAGVALSEMQARLLGEFATCTPRPVPEVPAVEILTSGTTGTPKQYPIRHEIFANFVRNQGMSRIEDPTDPPFLFASPIGNISGMYTTCGSLLQGKRIQLLDRFSIDAWLEYVRRYRPTTGGTPPPAVSLLLDAKVPKEDLASIKYFSTGAAPLDPTVQRQFEETYGIPVMQSYGATEFGGPVVAMTPDLVEQYGKAKIGTVGKPMPGVKLRLRDPETDELLPEGPGEGLLDVVSPRMGPEWIRTADMIQIDEDGFVFCKGRADGAIMRGGFKILPETIERALLLHPAISAAGVVAVADARLYEVPGAAVQLAPGADNPGIPALTEWLRERVLKTAIPVHWMFLDAMPVNASYKVDRQTLKRMFADQVAQTSPA